MTPDYFAVFFAQFGLDHVSAPEPLIHFINTIVGLIV